MVWRTDFTRDGEKLDGGRPAVEADGPGALGALFATAGLDGGTKAPSPIGRKDLDRFTRENVRRGRDDAGDFSAVENHVEALFDTKGE